MVRTGKLLLVGLGLAAITLLLGGQNVALAQGVWVTKAPMTTPRSDLAVASVNGALYAIGGSTSSGIVATVEVYDPTTNSWSTAADMPTPTRSLAAGVINGLVYAVGGFASGSATNLLQVFDPVANTWTTKSPMPTAREHLGVAVVNGILYAVGGCPAGSSCSYATSVVEAYDPSTDTWTTKASLPATRSGSATGSVSGIVYVAGGGDGSSTYATLFAYDPTTDSWSTKSPAPTILGGIAAAVLNDMFLTVGGGPNEITGELNSYNPTSDQWATEASMPTARNDPGAGIVGQVLYAIGGYDSSNTFLSVNEAFSLSSCTTPPAINISTPATSATYEVNEQVAAYYSCTSSCTGASIASCAGPVTNGSFFDTSSVGAKTFTVTAKDSLGNTATTSVNYSVTYKLCSLYDPSKSVKSGACIPIKLELCDFNGADQSSSSVTLQATQLTQDSNDASLDIEDEGNANPDDDFRFDSTLGTTGGYIFNLSTSGLSTGTYEIDFTATGDPVSHVTTFQVK